MSRPVIVLRSDEDLDVAAHIMRDKRIKGLPIIEAGKLAGLISLSDIARITHAEAERQSPALRLIAELIKDQVLYQNPPALNKIPAA
jgi:predicted transcriptional regulator